jgi:hypothetical protein
MKRIVVIEGTTKKVTQIKNVDQLEKLYPQLSVTIDAIVNSGAVVTGQAILNLLKTTNSGAPGFIQVYGYKDKLTSHNTSNAKDSTAVVCTGTIPTDTPAAGYITLLDATDSSSQVYRYSSYATTTFTLQSKSVSATTGGTGGTVLKIATGTFMDGTVCVGDIVRNSTDDSVAAIVSIDSATQITTSALTGGSDNTYTNGDTIKINVLDRAYNNTDYVYSPAEETIFHGVPIDATDAYTDEIQILNEIPSDTSQASYCFVKNAAGTYVRYRYTSALGKKIKLDTLKITAGSGGDTTTLIGSGFTAGAKVGDVVYNVTDGSHATIETVDSNTQVTTGALAGGTNNTYAHGDTVWIHVTAAAYTNVDKAIMYPWKKTTQALEIVLIDEFI